MKNCRLPCAPSTPLSLYWARLGRAVRRRVPVRPSPASRVVLTWRRMSAPISLRLLQARRRPSHIWAHYGHMAPRMKASASPVPCPKQRTASCPHHPLGMAAGDGSLFCTTSTRRFSWPQTCTSKRSRYSLPVHLTTANTAAYFTAAPAHASENARFVPSSRHQPLPRPCIPDAPFTQLNVRRPHDSYANTCFISVTISSPPPPGTGSTDRTDHGRGIRPHDCDRRRPACACIIDTDLCHCTRRPQAVFASTGQVPGSAHRCHHLVVRRLL